MAVSNHASALYRASYIPHDTVDARRSLRVLVTRHTGSGRFCPCRIKHRVQISCEICLVLLRISTQIVKEQSALAPIKAVQRHAGIVGDVLEVIADGLRRCSLLIPSLGHSYIRFPASQPVIQFEMRF